MAIAWKDVISKPEYQNLAPEAKAAAQEQYFNSVVAPQAGESAEAARQAFFSAYPLTSSAQATQPQPVQQDASQGQIPQVPSTSLNPVQSGEIRQNYVAANASPGIVEQTGQGIAEAGRATLQAGSNLLNIVPEVGDAVKSAAAWAGNKMGIGDGTYQPGARLQLPSELQPKTTAGRIAAEAIPYLVNPVAGAERAAAVGATRAERIGNQVVGSVAENATGALAQSSSTPDDGSNLATNLATGAAASGVVRGAIGGARSGLALFDRMTGRSASRAADEAAAGTANVDRNMTPQQAADANSPAPVAAGADDAVPSSARDEELLNIARTARTSADAGPNSAATQELARQVQPDNQVIEAAQRLGVDDALTPGMYSQNPAYRAYENALAATPGRPAFQAQREAIGRLGNQADRFINDFGGDVDKNFVNQQIKQRYDTIRTGFKEQENQIYRQIDEQLPKNTQIDADNTIRYLDSIADDIGGFDNLDAPLRKILKQLDSPEGTPTYGLLDKIRRDVGNAGANRGPYKDADQRVRDGLYASLVADQGRIAQQHGLGEMWDAAREIGRQRFAVQDAAQNALGKNLDGDVMTRLQKSVVDMAQGKGSDFRKILSNIPDDLHQMAAVTALNKAFTSFAKSPGQQLGVPGFVKWYNGMARNKSNMQALSRSIGYEGAKRLNDIYQVAKGMQRLGSEKVYSSSQIDRMLREFDADGGVVSKLWGLGTKIVRAEGLTSALSMPGVGTASTIAAALATPKTSRSVAADAVISSPAFKRFARALGKPSRARQAAEEALIRSPEFNRWYSTIGDEEKAEIARRGVAGFFAGAGQEAQQ